MLKKVEQYLVTEGLIDIEPSGRKTVDVSHYSPDWLIQAVHEVMGSIDLDPASCEIAQRRIQARHYCTEAMNGLNRHWKGRVYLNPNWENTAAFIDKAIFEWDSDRMTECIMAVHTQAVWEHWFWGVLNVTHALCFLNKRIEWVPAWLGYEKELEMLGIDHEKFPTYEEHGSLIAYLGPNPVGFAEIFKEYGTVIPTIGGMK